MKAVIMPKLGFTMTESTIVQWMKHEGDSVQQGEPIAEITTDKVNMEVEAPESGTLAGLKFKEGDTVPVTEIIAYILKVGERLVDDGRRTTEDRPSIMASPPIPSPSHFLPSATPIAVRMAHELGIDLATVTGTGAGGKITREDVEGAVKNLELRIENSESLPDAKVADGKVRATPAARQIAREVGIDLAGVSGSGPNQRIQSGDIREIINNRTKPSAISSKQSAAVGGQPSVVEASPSFIARPPSNVVPYTGMRKTIGTRLTQSYQQLPHIAFDADADVSLAEQLRARANVALKAGPVKISLTAIVVKACGWALRHHPMLNSRLDERAGQIVLLDEINIGVAVALENGLIVPVIRQADRKGIQQIAGELADLAARAKINKLRPDEIQGGTFSISNLGMFGVTRFTAIINSPETAILAVGAVRKQFVPDLHDQPVLRPLMGLRLSADHRVVDGAVAAQFLADLVRALEDPAIMTL